MKDSLKQETNQLKKSMASLEGQYRSLDIYTTKVTNLEVRAHLEESESRQSSKKFESSLKFKRELRSRKLEKKQNENRGNHEKIQKSIQKIAKRQTEAQKNARKRT